MPDDVIASSEKATQPPDTKPAFDPESPEIRQLIQSALDKEVSGLKSKNSELLNELKHERERLRSWEGLDPEHVRTVMQRLEQDEDAKAIAAGKIQEVVDRRTKTAVERALSEKAAAEEARKKAEDEAQTFRTRYYTSVVDNAVAGTVNGLAPGALPHVQRNVAEWFTVDDAGRIIPTDRAPLWPKAEKLTLELLKDYLLETSPFYFVPAAGGGATKGTSTITRKRSEMSVAEKAEFIRQRGQSEYLKLPA